MKDLALHPWHDVIQSELACESFGVKAAVKPTVAGPDNRLLFSQAILALNEVAVEMIHGDNFFNTDATISLRGVLTGRISIKFRPPFSVEDGRDDGTKAGNGTNVLTANSGTLRDPAYPGYKINWQYQNTRINSKDIFLAVLDGMATAAQPIERARCPHLEVVSPVSRLGQAIISLNDVYVSGDVAFLTYKDVIITLYLMFRDAIIGLTKFGKMSFQVYLQGSKRGEGQIEILPPVRASQSSEDATTS